MKHEANAVCLCPAFIFDLSEFEISKRFCKTSAEPFMVRHLVLAARVLTMLPSDPTSKKRQRHGRHRFLLRSSAPCSD
eukprot:692844-Hanusia_phi.AAC.6